MAQHLKDCSCFYCYPNKNLNYNSMSKMSDKFTREVTIPQLEQEDINKQIRDEVNSNQKSNELVDKMLEVQSDNPLERNKTVISDEDELNSDEVFSQAISDSLNSEDNPDLIDEELEETDWLTDEDLKDIDILDNDLDPRNEY